MNPLTVDRTLEFLMSPFYRNSEQADDGQQGQTDGQGQTHRRRDRRDAETRLLDWITVDVSPDGAIQPLNTAGAPVPVVAGPEGFISLICNSIHISCHVFTARKAASNNQFSLFLNRTPFTIHMLQYA